MTEGRLLKERYKTRAGADKRCRFENGIAKGEFEQGYKTRLYHYTVELDTEGLWRVRRGVKSSTVSPANWENQGPN